MRVIGVGTDNIGAGANDALPFAGVDSLDESVSSSDTSQKDNGNQTNTNSNTTGLSLFQPLHSLLGKWQ